MLNSPAASNWFKASPLEVLITRACDPSLPEPNYAVHLEVAEYIKNKKANTPREAAMHIARLTNNRNPHVAVLSLALLDTLVQSCGYPFHLQISTKEFLNELVRRFPERPPPFPGPVMSRILDLISTWKETICIDSRYKDDFKNIWDMHRLLMFKGYRFREGQSRQTPAVSANLKSAEELEKEDRDAQSAKLQELIRRGTPRDLAAAQELMKSLSGANPDTKPDYRAQALSEVNKLESKVVLLNEMLDNVDTTRGERMVAGDVYEQVAAILKAARPKIQKWISDAEAHDSEELDTFLQMNDLLNNSLERYEAYKRGDYTAAANPVPREFAQPQSDLSLIDFDDGSSGAAAPLPPSSGTDDLAGLFGSSQSPPTYSPSPMNANNALGNLMRNNSMSPPVPSGTPPASIMLPSTPGLGSPSNGSGRPSPSFSPPYTPQQPSYTAQAQQSLFGGQMFAQPQQQRPAVQQQQQSFGHQPIQPQTQQPQPQQQQQPPQNKDPFADLAGLF
ncbi:VHS-domain-containing protein [Cylindrobasidium torrendii FP15055 ss-10]|uniref:VHS-domain-containing protein n=1 Tax=Cylindrobasidium torrendii FP15055 ss-10 TaxID=1314674 RepID=A0A0D7BLV8_9AGAR|nr:VHS-domain-containing protein [Cylindrobasidium torrendii FP15055 ss-10]